MSLSLNWVDYVLLAVVAFSVVSGFRWGLARVGIGFAASVVGIFAGFWMYGIVGAHIQDYVGSPGLANLFGFLLIYLAVALAGALLGRLFGRLFKWIGLSWLDRLLGAAFGFVRGLVVIAAMATVLMAFAPNPPPASIVDSKTLPYVAEASTVLAALTPHTIKDAFRVTRDKVRRIWDGNLKSRPGKLRRMDA